MKRHLVMDLLHGNETEEVDGPWNSIEDDVDKINKSHAKLKLKLRDGQEVLAYFHNDRCGWIAMHGKETSYFWHAKTHDLIDEKHVTHWKFLKKD